jgi:cytochrome P450
MDDSEILLFFGLLVFAGNDTTRNTTSTGMLALLEHPDQLALLRDNPSQIPRAVEEILRYTSVINYFVRTATCGTVLGDQAIAEGEKVVVWYASASRDEDVYADAQRFDVTRARGTTTVPSAPAGATFVWEPVLPASSCASSSRRSCGACPASLRPGMPCGCGRVGLTH